MDSNFDITKKNEFVAILQKRFEDNLNRHKDFSWQEVLELLNKHPKKLHSVFLMDESGGEPDVVVLDEKKKTIAFVDCSKETPKERRNLCYDREALDKRKNFKPKNSAVDLANQMGIEILDEEQYHKLMTFGKFDEKTSSWLKTPESIRKLGGAIFGDHRFGRTFVYHNGADSYYGSRGFRGILEL